MVYQTAKCITDGEVWTQDYRVQALVHLKVEAWLKPLSAGCVIERPGYEASCVNTVVAC